MIDIDRVWTVVYDNEWMCRFNDNAAPKARSTVATHVPERRLMLKVIRQKAIAKLVEEGGAVEVSSLATRFQTSLITIRRDLVELQHKGLLERTRGGAISDEVIANGGGANSSYAAREVAYAPQKRAIARLAAQHISNGDGILINAGTTGRCLAEALREHQNLYVVTNGLTVAMELAKCHNASVYMLPGVIEYPTMEMVCRPESSVLGEINVHTAYLSVHTISPKHGISMLSQDSALMNRAFMDAASRTVVIADSSKFQSKAIFRTAHLDRVQQVITDEGIEAAVRDQLEALGVEVLVAQSKGDDLD